MTYLLVLTLITLFVYKIALGFSFSTESVFWDNLLNSIFLSFSVFLVLYSLFLVVQMTLNIFTISQMNHSVYFKESVDEVLLEEKLKKDEEEKPKEKD